MLWRTHIGLGDYIYNNILKKSGININKLSYIYGNFKPDIKNSDIPYLHYYNDSIEAVKKYFDEAVNCNDNKINYSKSLGVVSHFICDYFCYYHRNEEVLELTFSHFIYEFKLHHVYLYMRIFKKIKPKKFKFEFEFDNIEELVANMKIQYLKEEHSMINDINYAVGCIKMVLDRIEVVELEQAYSLSL